MVILFVLYLILDEKWHKLRANIHKSVIVQFIGWLELIRNWLYFAGRKSVIPAMPIHNEVQHAHSA
jgi:hypothetical protein